MAMGDDGKTLAPSFILSGSGAHLRSTSIVAHGHELCEPGIGLESSDTLILMG